MGLNFMWQSKEPRIAMKCLKKSKMGGFAYQITRFITKL
jgi:hypothetical protein